MSNSRLSISASSSDDLHLPSLRHLTDRGLTLSSEAVCDDDSLSPDFNTSTSSHSEEVKFMIFKQMTYAEGYALLKESQHPAGTFLIRESSTAGMLTVDVKKDELACASYRLQLRTDPRTHTEAWVTVSNEDRGNSMTLFDRNKAKRISAEDFSIKVIQQSLFETLTRLKHVKPELYVCANHANAAPGYDEYTALRFDEFRSGSLQETLNHL